MTEVTDDVFGGVPAPTEQDIRRWIGDAKKAARREACEAIEKRFLWEFGNEGTSGHAACVFFDHVSFYAQHGRWPDSFALAAPAQGEQERGAVALIAAERRRQLRKGYDAAHDDGHPDGEIAEQAALVLVHGTDSQIVSGEPFASWGIVEKWRGDRIRQLVIAGALVVAEIERLQRRAGVVAAPAQGEQERDATLEEKIIEARMDGALNALRSPALADIVRSHTAPSPEWIEKLVREVEALEPPPASYGFDEVSWCAGRDAVVAVLRKGGGK